MKLGFFFNIYKDERLAYRLCKQLNKFYPNNDRIIILDGPSYFTKRQNEIVVKGDRLKKVGSLGNFIKRNFQSCLDFSSADIFIGLDPDTFLWKPFESIPDADWFGQVNSIFYPPFEKNKLVVGACAGYSRKLIENLLLSGILDEPIVNDAPIYRPRLCNEECPAEDYVIGWALESLGYKPFQWEENNIRGSGRSNLQTKPYKYSATHPVKAAIYYDQL